MPQIKQLADGSLGIEGSAGGQGEFIVLDSEYNAASVDKAIFVASRPYQIQAITARIDTVGTDAGAVTAVVRKAASGVAITSGTLVHSGSVNLKGTINANQVLTLNTDASVRLAAGDALCIDFTGVLTTAVGVFTVTLTPL
jgi:hypothetical protein